MARPCTTSRSGLEYRSIQRQTLVNGPFIMPMNSSSRVIEVGAENYVMAQFTSDFVLTST